MEHRNLIGGSWEEAESGGTLEVTDPATDEVLARVPACGASETRRAIEAAREAFDAWRARPAEERASLLRRLADLMQRDEDRLARLMTDEQGKPLSEAAGEVAYAATFLTWAAGEAERIYGETIPASLADKRILVLRQAVGVCGLITPWNFPLAMITRKLGPALAAGCTAVVKPAEQTPLSAIALAELAVEAGAPAGVVNVLTGDPKAIGGELLSNPLVRKISFTGSTGVGQLLMRQAAENLTRLSLELGGHAPFIVFDDADPDAAAEGAIASKFRNAGQTCVCANRIYVQRGILEAFVDRFRAGVERLRVGRGRDEGVDVGPLIDDDAVGKVERHVEDARAHGAVVRLGGARVRAGAGLADRFFAPTILDGCTREMLLAREETFGPLAPIFPFETEAEAIERANDSEFGLASYFYTRDAARAWRVAEALEYGIVGLNDGKPSTAQAPFGGVKKSGFGREGGKYVMDEYQEIKYVSWGGISGP